MSHKKIMGVLAVIVMSFMIFGYLPDPLQAQTRPALTRDVDNGDRQTLFHHSWHRILSEPYFSIENCFLTVPYGKRLIIDHVSAWTSLGPSQIPLVKIYQLDGSQQHYIDMSYKGVASDKSRWTATQPMKMRFPPNGRACIYYSRSGGTTGDAEVYIEISGYEIDSP